MNSRTLEVERDVRANDLLDLNMEFLIEQIWDDLQGAVKGSIVGRQPLDMIERAWDRLLGLTDLMRPSMVNGSR